MTTTVLTMASVTKAPKMRPTKTEDGVHTGLWVTLSESVGLIGRDVAVIPAGTLLSSPICGGFHNGLGAHYQQRTNVSSGLGVVYRM